MPAFDLSPDTNAAWGPIQQIPQKFHSTTTTDIHPAIFRASLFCAWELQPLMIQISRLTTTARRSGPAPCTLSESSWRVPGVEASRR